MTRGVYDRHPVRGIYRLRPKFAVSTGAQTQRFTSRGEALIHIADQLKAGAEVRAWKLGGESRV